MFVDLHIVLYMFVDLHIVLCHSILWFEVYQWISSCHGVLVILSTVSNF